MSQASVKIAVNGVGQGSILVDGQDLSGIISGAAVKVAAGDATKVDLSLSAPDIESLDLSGVHLSIGDVVMPASVEMALYKHLTAKHGELEIDVTTLDSDSRRFGLKSA